MPHALLLLPLHAVLFPGGLLRLTVVAAPANALLQRCQRESLTFGVSCLDDGQSTPASVGVLARVDRIDKHGRALQVLCQGSRRFRLMGALERDDTGQWYGQVSAIADDPNDIPAATMFPTVQALGRAIATLRVSGKLCMNEPFRLNDAGWVANRWCELLPISLAAKQQLMELADPQARLALVDAYLRGQRVVR